MFKEHDLFYLTKRIPNEDSIIIGMRGVILMVYGGNPCAYEVEFVDTEGNNIGHSPTFTLTEDYITSFPLSSE